MKRVLVKLVGGIPAGILISIGGTALLCCSDKVVGALLFTIALVTICYKGYYLFTGKVGYLAERCKKDDVESILLGLLGNTIGAVGCGFLLSYAIGGIQEVAYVICSAKLLQSHPVALVRGIFCGILMYVAVSVFKENGKNVLGIMIGIPAFILSGFEHSIADLYYFAVSGIVDGRAFIFILVVILGNAIGGMLLPLFGKVKLKKEEKIEQ